MTQVYIVSEYNGYENQVLEIFSDNKKALDFVSKLIAPATSPMPDYYKEMWVPNEDGTAWTKYWSFARPENLNDPRSWQSFNQHIYLQEFNVK